MRIYLALQVFKDGRIMFRRWTPDNASGAPSGGAFQAQTLDAFQWLHCAGMPVWPEIANIEHTDPFEVLP
jgi:hypothetical protein